MHPEQTASLNPRTPRPLPRPTQQAHAQQLGMSPAIASMRKLLWAYFILLMVEGALRKWLLKGLSEPLLIIRDPIVMLIYYQAYNSGIFPNNSRIRFLMGLGVISIPLAVLGGSLNIAPILYGVRTNCLHFPLVFIIPMVFNYRDVIKIGRAILWLAPIMTFVVINQFQAGRDDVWNVAAGGRGHQLETSGGKVRASGTFSFVSGIVYYYAVLIAFLIIGFLRSGTYARPLLWIGVACTILAVATSGSRAVVAGVIHVLGCFGFLAAYNPRAFGSTFGFIISLTIAIVVLGNTEIYKEGMQFLQMRFDEASNVEGNAVVAYFNRNFEILKSPYRDTVNHFDIFGRGIGSGTQAGIRLGAHRAFFGENEWQRHIMESGIIVGNLFILWRVLLALYLLKLCIYAIKRENYLPIFIWGSCSHIILWMPIGQPTTLGFAALGGGLCLAAIRAQPRTRQPQPSAA